MTLAELQRRFFELITGAEGVAKELAARGVPAQEAEAAAGALAVGDARASAVERLDVYANMYFFRILDALRADYPKLLAVVGDDAFHDLATGYLLAHPSRHPSLRFVGAAMPAFVAQHGLARDRPWLAELAALEWARVDVFDRPDAAPLAREALAAVAPDDFASIALAPVPAFALVPVSWNVEQLWREIEDGAADAGTPAPAGHTLVVWRRGVTVHHRAADGDEALALAQLADGTTFGALCATLAERLGADDAAAARAVQLLVGWLADELLAAGPPPH
jgi:hypothetical protein